MKVLFIHQNFPGQFKHLVPALLARGDEVHGLTISGQAMPGVRLHRYRPHRSETAGMPVLLADFEVKQIRGEACARAALALRAAGFVPDLVVGHPGWGECLFIKEVWPHVRQLAFLEYFYQTDGADSGFDPEFSELTAVDEPAADLMRRARIRCKNIAGLMALESMDWGLTPTLWQRSTFPLPWQDRISVVFDGIDTGLLSPKPSARLNVPQRKLEFRPGDELVTFVNRNLEPYRGYHQMMRALPEIQRLRPNAYVMIVGGSGTSYGTAPPAGKSWKQIFLDELGDRINLERVLFVGNLPYETFISVLQVSACHVYLSYPFVLSWSMLEAMSVGCMVVGSDTSPVKEVLTHEENGLLVDFFDHQALASTVARVLAAPEKFMVMRQRARETVLQHYDLKSICLPRQIALLDSVARSGSAVLME